MSVKKNHYSFSSNSAYKTILAFIMLLSTRTCKEKGHFETFENNICNQKLIRTLIGPISKNYYTQEDQKFYLPKVADNNEMFFCKESLDFTCCDTKMLYSAYKDKQFLEDLASMKRLKGSVLKNFRIFKFLDNLNFDEELKKAIGKLEEDPSKATGTVSDASSIMGENFSFSSFDSSELNQDTDTSDLSKVSNLNDDSPGKQNPTKEIPLFETDIDQIFETHTQIQCSVNLASSFFEEIHNKINNNWESVKIDIYKFFESLTRYYGSFPCAVCNPSNNAFFDTNWDKIMIHADPMNCLDQIYRLQLLLKTLDIYSKIEKLMDQLRCLLREDKIHSDRKLPKNDISKVRNFIRDCSITKAFKLSTKCQNFCQLNFTEFFDKTNSLHLFELNFEEIKRVLGLIFPERMLEASQTNLEESVLVKLNRDISLDDGNFKYNMKSELWIEKYKLDKVQPEIPFMNTSSQFEKFYLAQFELEEQGKKISGIEEPHKKDIDPKLLDSENDGDIHSEHTNSYHIKNFIKSLNPNFTLKKFDENLNSKDLSVEIFPEGIELNKSFKMDKEFNFAKINLKTGFLVDFNKDPNSYSQFKEVYSPKRETVTFQFFSNKVKDLNIEYSLTYKNGAALFLLANEPNYIHLESSGLNSVKWLVCFMGLLTIIKMS